MSGPYRDRQIPVSVWLEKIALLDYAPLFSRFRAVQELFDVTDNGVLHLGVQNSAHRELITSSLKMLADKCRAASSTDAAADLANGSAAQSSSADSTGSAIVSPQLSGMVKISWFHGKISRDSAEKLVTQPEEFLVRESKSQTGSCVLTCNHQGQALHFVINKFNESSPGGSTSTEYGFESSRFMSIQALITSHLSEGHEITSASQAKIKIPINRRMPLTIAGAQVDSRASTGCPDYEATTPSTRLSPRTVAGRGSPKHTRGNQVLEHSLARVGSVPQLYKKVDDSKDELTKTSTKLSNSSMLKVSSSLNSRAQSEGHLNVSPSQLPQRSVELKTSRSVAAHPVIAIRNRALYDEGADYSDYFEVKRMPDEKPSVMISPPITESTNGSNQLGTTFYQPNQSKPATHTEDLSPSLSQVSTGQANNLMSNNTVEDGGEDYDTPAAEVREIHQFTVPIIPANHIDPNSFYSEFLANQNKPLDPDCMYKLKEVLLQVNYQLISQHITYLDLHLLKVITNRNLGAGIFSGIEALTLPQGQHFRRAAIERHSCFSFVVSVTILACTDDLMERSQMVKHWILIAKELLRSHGNLFSFAAIMHGLVAPSINRLKMTWNILERCEPVLMNHWKTKLKPTYKELSSGASSLSLDNVSVPYVTPICELLEESVAWGDAAGDADDLITLLAQLDLARLMAGQVSEYNLKGVTILRYFVPRPDLRDLFKVELHMRLLFGHRGALAQRSERTAKFEQILNILSGRAENNDMGTEF